MDACDFYHYRYSRTMHGKRAENAVSDDRGALCNIDIQSVDWSR
jgi:hypothetical protein